MADNKTRIEYMPLSALQRWPRNPKAHDLGALHTSINRFGFVAPITMDERTGKLVAGHGRLDALQQMKASGKDAPAGIEERGGEWYAPVVRGVAFNSDSELEAYLVADNRLTELGGWEQDALAALLSDLAAEDEALLQATGYDADDLDALLAELGQGADDNQYSRKIEAPTYEPTGETPDAAELYDDGRTRALIAGIDAADELSEDVRQFLRIAAQRHTVLNFAKIAEFYAHADEVLQTLMEDSALVMSRPITPFADRATQDLFFL